MFGKLVDLFALFRKGNELANADVWKDRANAISILVPLIVLLVKIAGDFGYTVQLSSEDATAISTGIVAVVQFILHNITSSRAGLLPAKAAEPASNSNTAVKQDVPKAEAAKPVVQPKPAVKPEQPRASEPKADDFDPSLYRG